MDAATQESAIGSPYGLAWVDGVLTPIANVVVPVMSQAVFRGTTVFDVMPVVTVDGDRYAVGFDEHFERLLASAEAMCLDVPYSLDDFRDAVAAIATTGRCTVWTAVIDTGSPSTRTLPDRRGGGPATAVTTTPMVTITATHHDDVGAGQQRRVEGSLDMVSATAKIDPAVIPPGVKVAASYAGGIRQERLGAGDGIINFSSDGRLLEAVSASVGVVCGDVVYFPSLDVVLDSVTRRLVIDVAKSAGIDVEVTMLDRADVDNADALFLASAGRPVVAVGSLDHRRFDTEHPTLEQLRAGVAEVFAGTHELCGSWLTGLDSGRPKQR